MMTKIEMRITMIIITATLIKAITVPSAGRIL